ncbi:laccase [Punctularia strigosozonata HHB-11173 SS5]|uniref:laccase n=1 Tax=Punctularia strigosozonata (strain HHB-11173) TaxID=741275 RepID=UPI0004417E47|nr:laccase [Punctularia strigosozonata HHB-11173 SS5]EIN07541.1 laccase [Punctularia strigosozonata HHB-11173 SS5]
MAVVLAAFFAILLAAGACLAALPPHTNLPIVNGVIAPDGFPRPAVLAGGTFPGPLIAANKGEDFAINVQDYLHDTSMNRTTTVHWHGIQQRYGSVYADGPAFVTQCPIAPNHSFPYQFNPINQTGTHWYHSHESLQYCDGLRGPLVIYDPDDPAKHLYDIDDESTVITLSDWYHNVSSQIPAPLQAWSTLINGKGRYLGGPDVNLATINVEHGKRYRFRLVSMSCDPSFNFSIDGHSMTIIEVEGNNVQPLEVGSLNILAAQRYSFVLNANKRVDNYWIRAQPNDAMYDGFFNGVNSAVLHYVGASSGEPTQNVTSPGSFLLETNLHPLQNAAAPQNAQGEADVYINLAFNFTAGLFTVNGVPFIPPPVPVLLQILKGAKTAHEIAPVGSVYTLPRNKVIQVSMPGANVDAIGGPHPVHLHGHAFSVVRSAGSDKYNFHNPVKRDTVSIGGASDNVTIRFVTDNPGPWFLHCHIEPHLNAGFAVVFAEDVPDIPTTDRTTDSWRDLCPSYDLLPLGER